MGMTPRRAIVFEAFFVLFVIGLYLAIFGLFTLVSQVSGGLVKADVLGGIIVVVAEVTIAIAVSGEVFVTVSNFLLNAETCIITT